MEDNMKKRRVKKGVFIVLFLIVLIMFLFIYFIYGKKNKNKPVSTQIEVIDSIDDFYIFGTPFMIEIKEHSVSGYYAGANEILESISILNKK